jgi:hypothetical protein
VKDSRLVGAREAGFIPEELLPAREGSFLHSFLRHFLLHRAFYILQLGEGRNDIQWTSIAIVILSPSALPLVIVLKCICICSGGRTGEARRKAK